MFYRFKMSMSRKSADRLRIHISGTHKLILSEQTQNEIECVAGVDISPEHFWKFVDTDVLRDQLRYYGKESEFFRIQKQIKDCRLKEILIGYKLNRKSEDDKFLVCLTKESIEKAIAMYEKEKEIQDEKVMKAIEKNCGNWTPLGSEKEIVESIQNRPLLEAEVESKPYNQRRVHFSLRLVENSKYGYVELTCPVDEQIIKRARISKGVQAAAIPKTVGTQTGTMIFKNNTIQCDLIGNELLDNVTPTFDKNAKVSEETLKNIDDAFMCNFLNLHDLEYDKLIKNENSIFYFDTVKYHESFVLMDAHKCKAKCVSSGGWHKLWSSTYAMSYADTAPNMYFIEKEKIRNEEHYEPNYVLIFCLEDKINPTFVLECDREVTAIQFCDFNEHILIGGCKNGQVVLWEIPGLLERNNKQVFTREQLYYKSYMSSLMSWMKIIDTSKVIRPTAVSNFKYSHKEAVLGIKFLSPFYEYTKTGKLLKIKPEENRTSLQFHSLGSDGTVLIWDLYYLPQHFKEGPKPRRFRRLKKKPSALTISLPKFHHLRLNFIPKYKIDIVHNGKFLPLMSFTTTNFPKIKYQRKDNGKIDANVVHTYYAHAMDSQEETTKTYIGTMSGELAVIEWSGLDYDAGEVVNFENCTYTHFQSFHDGPVVTTKLAKFTDIVMTVGGKTFALWNSNLKEPVIWRKGEHLYNTGVWENYSCSSNLLFTTEGNAERWCLFNQSKTITDVYKFGCGQLTTANVHPRQLNIQLLTVADEIGVVRGLQSSSFSNQNAFESTQLFLNYMQNETEAMQKFHLGQLAWKNVSKTELVVEEMDRAPDEVIEKVEEPQKQEVGKSKEKIRLKERIASCLRERLQVNEKELIRLREPMLLHDKENAIKKKKQKDKLGKADSIFQQAVSNYFPKLIKSPTSDPYAGGDTANIKLENYNYYKNLVEQCNSRILVLSKKSIKMERRPHLRRFKGKVLKQVV